MPPFLSTNLIGMSMYCLLETQCHGVKTGGNKDMMRHNAKDSPAFGEAICAALCPGRPHKISAAQSCNKQPCPGEFQRN